MKAKNILFKGFLLKFWPYVRLVFKSGFWSRAGYNCARTVYNMGYYRALFWPYTCLHFSPWQYYQDKILFAQGGRILSIFHLPLFRQHIKMKNYLFEMINKFQTSRNTVWYVCSWRTRKLRSFEQYIGKVTIYRVDSTTLAKALTNYQVHIILLRIWKLTEVNLSCSRALFIRVSQIWKILEFQNSVSLT